MPLHSMSSNGREDDINKIFSRNELCNADGLYD